MKLPSVSMPTGGVSSGWSHLGIVPVGNACRIFAGFDTSTMALPEFAKAVSLRQWIQDEAFVVVLAAAQASPYNGFNQATTPNAPAWLVENWYYPNAACCTS